MQYLKLMFVFTVCFLLLAFSTRYFNERSFDNDNHIRMNNKAGAK